MCLMCKNIQRQVISSDLPAIGKEVVADILVIYSPPVQEL